MSGSYIMYGSYITHDLKQIADTSFTSPTTHLHDGKWFMIKVKMYKNTPERSHNETFSSLLELQQFFKSFEMFIIYHSAVNQLMGASRQVKPTTRVYSQRSTVWEHFDRKDEKVFVRDWNIAAVRVQCNTTCEANVHFYK